MRFNVSSSESSNPTNSTHSSTLTRSNLLFELSLPAIPVCSRIDPKLFSSHCGTFVSELKNDTFYAKILVEYNGATIEIDSRPSDAIALAVRANAPIFAEEDVVEQAGVNLANEISEAGATAAGNQTDTPVDEEELRRLSAFTDFIDTLDLEDLGKDG